MKPVVLLVGRLPAVVETVARELEDLPVQWLGAHNRDEVVSQLESEPDIATVVMGAGLDDRVRGDLIGVIAGLRPDLCIHVKDRASGPAGMAPFVRGVVLSELLGEYA
ncbi:hypothetical protein KU6B_34900 [Mameliella alba]|uniref:Uncharacterized protein n=1 Tax=Mameliella alba TaxID=561184 RepID=A0A0B3SGK4_9RHOB|nr:MULTISPECIES: hypothetical protein [Mameliella]KHQ49729.1 hypothetical protein OA50_05725 [Mameliella alba]MDD9730963.1 hypothetical protein [Mameliella sp. AT18]ODM49818.1 hypothetical protein A9320_13795 [Ruegeria sp. PBVC088]BBU57225.1 hypothetical protein KU6B_34900 [Mameliella alba]